MFADELRFMTNKADTDVHSDVSNVEKKKFHIKWWVQKKVGSQPTPQYRRTQVLWSAASISPSTAQNHGFFSILGRYENDLESMYRYEITTQRHNYQIQLQSDTFHHPFFQPLIKIFSKFGKVMIVARPSLSTSWDCFQHANEDAGIRFDDDKGIWWKNLLGMAGIVRWW